jgi:hypothetical protein
METSVLIARILAVVYLAAAFGAFFNPDSYRKIAEDVYKNAALTYLMGFIAVVVGSLIVHFHNSWTRDWTVLITIVGWLALLKGITLIALPHIGKRMTEGLATRKGLKVFPYVALLLGLAFGYLGFCCGTGCPFRG